jgi:hypothetical protein
MKTWPVVHNLVLIIILSISVPSGCIFSQKPVSSSQSDTINIRYAPTLEFKIPQRHAYHQTLTMKLFLSQAKFDGQYKRRDNGISDVSINYNQALDIVRSIDNITLGIPKIIYLVGWQYNGHDSKYPAWFEGNEKLKRAQDATSLESLKWLMKEAKKYNTTVSLHINMFDAYDDSPLWPVYLENDIIAKDTNGLPRAAEWGYPISYAQEWKTGWAQKRIDSLCKLLPIQKAGTIHIDAFHTWPPIPGIDKDGHRKVNLVKGPISPYLPFSIADETRAQQDIFRYWSSKGVDVTSEGVDFLRETAFEGFQAMAWWFGGLDNYLKWPASYYCGGRDNSDWGKLFGTSMHGEDLIKKDPTKLTGFAHQFCTRTAVWYFLNRLNRIQVTNHPDYKSVKYSQQVTASLNKGKLIIQSKDAILVENDDVLIPALWVQKPTLIAYSLNGYKQKVWTMPPGWEKIKTIKVYECTMNKRTKLSVLPVVAGKLTLSLSPDQMLILER